MTLSPRRLPADEPPGPPELLDLGDADNSIDLMPQWFAAHGDTYRVFSPGREFLDLGRRSPGRRQARDGDEPPQLHQGRPEVIIPFANGHRSPVVSQQPKVTEGGIRAGETIRIIREPHFGVLARVKALPAELQQIPTESHVRVLIATLPDGSGVTIPRANVEMIEE